MRARSFLLCAAMLVPPVAGRTQDTALDDKLRDLLRQSTVQLRAAQDTASTLQASLDAMTKQRDQLQAQLDAAKAAPAAPAAPVVPPQQLQQAQEVVRAAQAQAARASAAADRLQAQVSEAQGVAQAKDASDRRNAAALKTANGMLGICKIENNKLVAIATDILHLYETPHFQTLLGGNHERVLGFKRVELQNLVQDYDDKIAGQVDVQR